MPRKPQPPKQDPPTGVAAGMSAMYPADQSRVPCRLCSKPVSDIEFHLKREHPMVRFTEYKAEFPNAPLKGANVQPVNLNGTTPEVSKKEADKHPGGLEGAVIEKQIGELERKAFRESIIALKKLGYDDLYLISSVAYYQVQAKRWRSRIEAVRELSGGETVPGKEMEALNEVEEKIRSAMNILEKKRQADTPEEGEDGIKVVERTMIEAEDFIRTKQGEFVDACPHCHGILQPPALPHWAFAPVSTAMRGTEWCVWSPEMWTMVTAGTIELWVMAYALRCSPEGLQITAQKRGEKWLSSIDLEVQEAKLRLVLDERDRPKLPVMDPTP